MAYGRYEVFASEHRHFLGLIFRFMSEWKDYQGVFNFSQGSFLHFISMHWRQWFS
jgi:hypothetical protein